jgi:plasmid segregation protein ParM
MTEIVGLDVGRNMVKVCTAKDLFAIPSVVGEGIERKLKTDYKNGFEVVFEGEHYFVGELAQHESDYYRTMMTDSKAHPDTLILALTALHRAGIASSMIVTGLPVDQHDEPHRKALRDLLVGPRSGVWEITVNEERRFVRITDVKVAVEGGGAFWSAPQDGLVRIIDAGSKTVNYVTMRDRRYNNRESGTLPFGFSTNKSDNPKQFAARVAGEVGKKWSANDTVLVSGGRAAELAELLTPYFHKATPIQNGLFANAIGFYRAGCAAT